MGIVVDYLTGSTRGERLFKDCQKLNCEAPLICFASDRSRLETSLKLELMGMSLQASCAYHGIVNLCFSL